MPVHWLTQWGSCGRKAEAIRREVSLSRSEKKDDPRAPWTCVVVTDEVINQSSASVSLFIQSERRPSGQNLTKVHSGQTTKTSLRYFEKKKKKGHRQSVNYVRAVWRVWLGMCNNFPRRKYNICYPTIMFSHNHHHPPKLGGGGGGNVGQENDLQLTTACKLKFRRQSPVLSVEINFHSE